MLLDMKEILTGDRNILDFDITLDSGECGEYAGYTEDTGLTFPIRITGCVKNAGGLMTLYMNASLSLETECARCAEPASCGFEMSVEKTVASRGDVSGDGDDYLFIENGKLDILTPFFEQFLLEKPSKVLCKEDCRGLCPRCGKNLNEGGCSCPTSEDDPRLAILKTLLDK